MTKIARSTARLQHHGTALLSGLALCSKCGQALGTSIAGARSAVRYCCLSRQRGYACTTVHACIPQERLHHDIDAMIARLGLFDDAIDTLDASSHTMSAEPGSAPVDWRELRRAAQVMAALSSAWAEMSSPDRQAVLRTILASASVDIDAGRVVQWRGRMAFAPWFRLIDRVGK